MQKFGLSGDQVTEHTRMAGQSGIQLAPFRFTISGCWAVHIGLGVEEQRGCCCHNTSTVSAGVVNKADPSSSGF